MFEILPAIKIQQETNEERIRKSISPVNLGQRNTYELINIINPRMEWVFL